MDPAPTLLRREPRVRAVAHFGAQALSLRPWMNALRVPKYSDYARLVNPKVGDFSVHL
jgi:hypothetical protein